MSERIELLCTALASISRAIPAVCATLPLHTDFEAPAVYQAAVDAHLRRVNSLWQFHTELGQEVTALVEAEAQTLAARRPAMNAHARRLKEEAADPELARVRETCPEAVSVPPPAAATPEPATRLTKVAGRSSKSSHA